MLMQCPTNQPLSVGFPLQLSYLHPVGFPLQVSYLHRLSSLIIYTFTPYFFLSSYIPYFYFLPSILVLTSSFIHPLYSCKLSCSSIAQPYFTITLLTSDIYSYSFPFFRLPNSSHFRLFHHLLFFTFFFLRGPLLSTHYLDPC